MANSTLQIEYTRIVNIRTFTYGTPDNDFRNLYHILVVTSTKNQEN